MRYDGTLPFATWQNTAREKLRELLGLPFERCDPRLEIEYETELEDAREIRFTFQSENGYFVPCHLLIPATAKQPPPVAICLQGHTKGMHISLGRPKYPGDEAAIRGGDRDFALRAVREGYCALVMEQRNFGECGGGENGPECYGSSMTALLIGRTTAGERVWDVQRAIDVLEKHFPQADKNQILCLGHSGGGTAAFYAACLDERIKRVIASCAVCTYEASLAAVQIHHCACNFIPNIRKYFDMGDLGGLIAPRKLVVAAGREDGAFPVDGVTNAFDMIQTMYRAAGCGENCALVTGGSGHRFYADQTWDALRRI
jgi:cephalosporin-C deacetylase-like acetyl esterase